MIKLVAIDLDGTLLNENHVVSLKNQEALNRIKDDVVVVVSTGRTYTSAKKVLKDIPLTKYMVGSNGGMLCLKDGTILDKKLLDTSIALRIFDLILKYDLDAFVSHLDGIVINNDSEIAKHYQNESAEGIVITNDKDFISTLSILKLLAVDESGSRTKLDLLEKELASIKEIDVTSSGTNNIEIMPKGVNKKTGLEVILNEYGITWDEVMTFGDNLNDFEMIQAAKYGIAMGNGRQEVKDVAFLTTLPNTQDGVAYMIDQLIK